MQLEIIRAHEATAVAASDQLVLYLDSPAAVDAATAPLKAAGLTANGDPHPYWAANGAVISQLSDNLNNQRVAFYEFVTSSLKAAETLARACPADTALTPVGRMAVLRVRLAAVREATTAIHPALRRFSEALDQEQRIRFAITR